MGWTLFHNEAFGRTLAKCFHKPSTQEWPQRARSGPVYCHCTDAGVHFLWLGSEITCESLISLHPSALWPRCIRTQAHAGDHGGTWLIWLSDCPSSLSCWSGGQRITLLLHHFKTNYQEDRDVVNDEGKSDWMSEWRDEQWEIWFRDWS